MFAVITKRIVTVALVACLVGSSSASAGLIFSVAKTSPTGDVPVGSATAAVFGVFVRSDVPNQSFLGADFSLAISSASGAGGRYVAGTNDLLVPGAGGFIGSSPFAPPGAVAVNFSSLANDAVTLGTTDTLLATLTLSTAGADALEGNYSMTLSGLDAIDSGFNQLTVASAGPVNYTITAVPEPTTIVSLGMAAGIAGFGVARKKLRRAKAGSSVSRS